LPSSGVHTNRHTDGEQPAAGICCGIRRSTDDLHLAAVDVHAKATGTTLSFQKLSVRLVGRIRAAQQRPGNLAAGDVRRGTAGQAGVLVVDAQAGLYRASVVTGDTVGITGGIALVADDDVLRDAIAHTRRDRQRREFEETIGARRT